MAAEGYVAISGASFASYATDAVKSKVILDCEAASIYGANRGPVSTEVIAVRRSVDSSHTWRARACYRQQPQANRPK